jgi:hypothetical protein
MTLIQFSQLIDVNRAHLSRIVHGRTFPSRRLARDIWRATNGIVNLETKPRKNNDKKNHEEK